MELDEGRIDDIRAAALLHDIGKLETSREILCKAANLTSEETVDMRIAPLELHARTSRRCEHL